MKEERAERKALTKDRLVGMKVVDGGGHLVGEVEDIAFTVGNTPVSMVMILKANDGGNKEVPLEKIQAAGDFVLLKPQTTTPSTATTTATCPTCGDPLTYVQQYQRWYCTKCQKYA